MKLIEQLNAGLQSRNCNVRVTVDKVYIYRDGKVMYDAWLEYLDTKRGIWRALHNLGRFSTEKQCFSAALIKLKMDKYV